MKIENCTPIWNALSPKAFAVSAVTSVLTISSHMHAPAGKKDVRK
jgi:hypothetical protein